MSENKPSAVPSVHDVVLLPCPFCGSAADDTQGFHGLTVIGCSHCQTAQTSPFDDYSEAVRVWNRRDGDPCRDGCKIKRAVKEMSDSATADFAIDKPNSTGIGVDYPGRFGQ